MPPANARNTALFIAVLAGFLTPFDLSAVTIALPILVQEFSIDAIQIGWVSTAFLLASTCVRESSAYLYKNPRVRNGLPMRAAGNHGRRSTLSPG